MREKKVQKMAKEQRNYEKEYKIQAVKPTKEIGAGKAAKAGESPGEGNPATERGKRVFGGSYSKRHKEMPLKWQVSTPI